MFAKTLKSKFTPNYTKFTPNLPIRTINFSKKSMFSTLKNKRSQKFTGSTQNPEKFIETSNQPIRMNIFPNKKYLVTQKCKRAKNSYEGYPTEFAGSTQNHKKSIGTPNLPIKTNIFLKKKVCLVPKK
jgi:hypothetical protein